MTRLPALVTTCAVLATAACDSTPRAASFPTFSESQSEWLHDHCRIAWIDAVDGSTERETILGREKVDIIERLATSSAVVELVGYRCSSPVPQEVARGDKDLL